jgi:hypothetical protein
MFARIIEALKTAETAAEEELAALWVPFDPATGGGNVYWHSAGASILQNAKESFAALRAELEKRQAPIDAAEAQAATLAEAQSPPEEPPAPAPPETPAEEAPETPAEEEHEEGPSMPVPDTAPAPPVEVTTNA